MLTPKKKITKQEIMDNNRFLRSQKESKVTKKFTDIAKDAEKSDKRKMKNGGKKVMKNGGKKTRSKVISKRY